MVVIPKKNGKLRICSDPMDLNHALQQENYPMPTIEDVASRLHRAYKVFTSLDVSNRFWRVVLNEESSFSTTFNVHRLGDTTGKGCRSGSDLHLNCFSVKCRS